MAARDCVVLPDAVAQVAERADSCLVVQAGGEDQEAEEDGGGGRHQQG